MNKSDFSRYLRFIEYPDFEFDVLDDGDSRQYLQATFYAKDTITGEFQVQKSRKWMLSEYMTKSEFVQTVFKCVMTAVEHEVREAFLYKSERVFSPHFDIDELVNMCQRDQFDEREAA